MDGTLFDTFAATKKAYELSGVTEYKKEFWGLNYKEWGCPEEIHREKRRWYTANLTLIEPAWALPYYDVAERTGHAVILTGASEDTVKLLREHFSRVLPCPFGYSLSWADKQRVIKNLVQCGYTIRYYDDQVDIGSGIVCGFDFHVELMTQKDFK
jgi:hypothetical protein